MNSHLEFTFRLALLVLFSSTTFAYYTSSSSEEYEDFSRSAQFYYSRGSYHVTNIGNASFNCVKLPKYENINRLSTATDGGACAILYAREDCSGGKIVAPPGYDSSFVYDDVGSFGPCPPPKHADVSLYADTRFNNLMVKYEDVRECKTLPTSVLGRAQSLHTHGTCVHLYEHRDCKGEMLEVTPATLYHWDLDRFEFGNMTRSISGCNLCSSFKLQAKITKFRFANTLKEDLLKGQLFKVEMAAANNFVNNATSKIKRVYSNTQRYRETFRFEKIESLSNLHKVEVGSDATVETGSTQTDEQTQGQSRDQMNSQVNENVNSQGRQQSQIRTKGWVTDQRTEMGTNQQTSSSSSQGTQSGTNQRTETLRGYNEQEGSSHGTNFDMGGENEFGSSSGSESSNSNGEQTSHTAGGQVGGSVNFLGIFSVGGGGQYEFNKAYSKASENRMFSNRYGRRSSRFNAGINSQSHRSRGTYGHTSSGTDSHSSQSSNSQRGQSSGSHHTSSTNVQQSESAQNSDMVTSNNQQRRMSTSQNSIASFSNNRRASQSSRSDSTRAHRNEGDQTVDDSKDAIEYVSETWREFSIQEKFTVSPCVKLEMSTFMLEKKDMPLEFEVELEFSEEGGCLNWNQLRMELPQGMEYVRPLSEFAILAKTKGRIIAKLGVKTEVEIHESPIPECQKRLMNTD